MVNTTAILLFIQKKEAILKNEHLAKPAGWIIKNDDLKEDLSSLVILSSDFLFSSLQSFAGPMCDSFESSSPVDGSTIP